jgi:hypothetical protein
MVGPGRCAETQLTFRGPRAKHRVMQRMTRQLVVRVEPELATALQQRAVAEDRTQSQEVRRALRRHLASSDSPPAEGPSGAGTTPAVQGRDGAE